MTFRAHNGHEIIGHAAAICSERLSELGQGSQGPGKRTPRNLLRKRIANPRPSPWKLAAFALSSADANGASSQKERSGRSSRSSMVSVPKLRQCEAVKGLSFVSFFGLKFAEV